MFVEFKCNLFCRRRRGWHDNRVAAGHGGFLQLAGHEGRQLRDGGAGRVRMLVSGAGVCRRRVAGGERRRDVARTAVRRTQTADARLQRSTKRA